MKRPVASAKTLIRAAFPQVFIAVHITIGTKEIGLFSCRERFAAASHNLQYIVDDKPGFRGQCCWEVPHIRATGAESHHLNSAGKAMWIPHYEEIEFNLKQVYRSRSFGYNFKISIEVGFLPFKKR